MDSRFSYLPMHPGEIQYPVNLRLAGRRALVVGGGGVAHQKVRGLLHAGALVHVIATRVDDAIKALEGLTWEERGFRDDDLEHLAPEQFALVMAATDDRRVNRRVFEAARDARIPVNTADDPELCDFTLPAVLRQGRLMVTVSTGGESPAVSSWLRKHLEADLGPEYDEIIGVVAQVRNELHEAGQTTMKLDWQSALDSGILEMVRQGRLSEAKERLQACLS